MRRQSQKTQNQSSYPWIWRISTHRLPLTWITPPKKSLQSLSCFHSTSGRTFLHHPRHMRNGRYYRGDLTGHILTYDVLFCFAVREQKLTSFGGSDMFTTLGRTYSVSHLTDDSNARAQKCVS